MEQSIFFSQILYEDSNNVVQHVWVHGVCPVLGCLDSTIVYNGAETPWDCVDPIHVLSASKLPQSGLVP